MEKKSLATSMDKRGKKALNYRFPPQVIKVVTCIEFAAGKIA